MTGRSENSKRLRQRFYDNLPNGFFLDQEDTQSIAEYLKEIGVFTSDERLLSVEKPGQGNMNLVLRVKSDKREVIIKQARPWAERYPQINAPSERADMESLFYLMIQDDQILQKAMPKLINNDRNSKVLIMEDLGKTSDLINLYAGEKIRQSDIDQLISYLSILHSRFNKVSSAYYISNKHMRELNYQHMFKIPFDTNNGLDLDGFSAGLRSVTNNLLKDKVLMKKVKEIGDVYLKDGNTLLHGDFYPGSWLRKAEKIYVIDPEFCFFGCKEFDLGIFIAHLVMSDQPKALISDALQQYKKQIEIDESLVNSFVGVEMLRRILGVAQLPLTLSLKEKKVLIDMGRELVLSHKNSILPLY